MTRWLRIITFGILTWLIPFIAHYAFLWLEMVDVGTYRAVVLLVGVITVTVCLVLYLPSDSWYVRAEGIIVGVVWFIVNLVLDSALHYLINDMDQLTYWTLYSWSHIHILVIAAGTGIIAEAMRIKYEPRRVPEFPTER
jgi:hypothetical protein